MTQTLYGIGGSPGFSIGQAVWWERETVSVAERSIQQPHDEITKLEKAITRTKEQLTDLRQLTATRMSEEEAMIFDVHLSFLDDPSFTGEMKSRIEGEKKNAEAICERVVTEMHSQFQSLSDDYMRARAEDIYDVGNRLLQNMQNKSLSPNSFPPNSIIIATDLTPSDTVQFSKKIIGIITAKGNKNSHAAIIARTLGIPAVFGLHASVGDIKNGDHIMLDGENGMVYVNPTQEEQQSLADKMQTHLLHTKNALHEAAQNTYTSDGKRIPILANVGNSKDLDIALANHAEGIGLFRTEFLYIENNDWPTEEEQFAIYAQALELLSLRPVMIRTLDIGGDKHLPYATLPTELNPYLGCRGIRFCLANKSIFKTQLRALLRASAYGDLWILLPMIENPSQIREVKQLLTECRAELLQEGTTIKEPLKLGAMIEIPAAALTADTLAKEVDFFSIGTNDLTQYTLAADRDNEHVIHLYDETHPAVFRLIEMVCAAAYIEGIPVSLCGELAGNTQVTESLIRMGIEKLSVTPYSIPRIKQIVRKSRSHTVITK